MSCTLSIAVNTPTAELVRKIVNFTATAIVSPRKLMLIKSGFQKPCADAAVYVKMRENLTDQ